MMASPLPMIIIVGPTGVGKTALSLHVSDVVCSLLPSSAVEIVSMDSMQLYGPGMGIANAVLKAEENPSRVKHYLLEVMDCLHGISENANADESAVADFLESQASYGCLLPNVLPIDMFPTMLQDSEPMSPLPPRFTVRTFISALSDLLPRIYARSGVPVICGGTIYYLYNWLFPEPTDDDDGSSQSDNEPSFSPYPLGNLSASPASEAYARLSSLAPAVASKLHPSNTRKVLAALSRLSAPHPPPPPSAVHAPPPAPLLIVRLGCSRDELKTRQSRRVDSMIRSGVLREVATLRSRLPPGYRTSPPQTGAFQSIGYKELLPFVSDVFAKAAVARRQHSSTLGEASESDGASGDDAVLLPRVSAVLKAVEDKWPETAAADTSALYDHGLLQKCVASLLSATVRYGKKQEAWLDNKLLPRLMSLQSGRSMRAGMPDITVVEVDTTSLEQWSEVKTSISQMLEHFFDRNRSFSSSSSSFPPIIGPLRVVTSYSSSFAELPPTLLPTTGDKCSRPKHVASATACGFHSCVTCARVCHGDDEWIVHLKSKMHKARCKAERTGKDQHVREMKEKYAKKRQADSGSTPQRIVDDNDPPAAASVPLPSNPATESVAKPATASIAKSHTPQVQPAPVVSGTQASAPPQQELQQGQKKRDR